VIIGHIGVVVCLPCVAIFEKIGQDILVLVFLIIFVCIWNFGIGAIFNIHVLETNIDSIVGFSNQVLFLWVVVTIFVTPILM